MNHKPEQDDPQNAAQSGAGRPPDDGPGGAADRVAEDGAGGDDSQHEAASQEDMALPEVDERPKHRLFFALWPDEPCRKSLSQLAQKAVKDQGRLVALENLHLTLYFLGAVTSELRECAEQAAKHVRAEPFVLRLDRFGSWPKPGVAWSAPSRVCPELRALVESLQSGLGECGFVPESRPFEAHITLARKVKVSLPELNHTPVVWRVGRFHLVESSSYQGGVRYQPLKSWPLKVL